NRLKQALYYNAANPTINGRFNELTGDPANPNRPSYDLNGNILNLLRSGKTAEVDGLVTYGAMDNLVYSYDGNRLLKVTESAVTTEGFKDGSNEGNDYGYDDNGNMIIDLNKG